MRSAHHMSAAASLSVAVALFSVTGVRVMRDSPSLDLPALCLRTHLYYLLAFSAAFWNKQKKLVRWVAGEEAC